MSDADFAIEKTHTDIGDNRSLSERFADLNAEIAPLLHQQNHHLLTESHDLKAECVDIPHAIADDDTEKTLTDLGVRLQKYLRTLEIQRKSDKMRPAESADLVEKFFRSISGPLATSMDTIRSRLNDYKNRKAAEERRKIEEQRRAAQEAQRQADEARRIADEARRQQETSAAETGHLAEEIDAHEAQQAALSAKAAVEKPVVVVTAKADSGATSGQMVRWTGEIDDIDALDLDALRPFIKRDALEQAVRAFALQHKDATPLRGARLFQKTTTTFRS